MADDTKSGWDPLIDEILGSMSLLRDQINKRIDGLEAKLTMVETKQADWKHTGTWDESREYVENNLVTHAGSTWIALRACKGQRPGDGSDGWRLIVKGQR